MNISELKKSMDLVAFFTANDKVISEYLRDDLKKVLDTCQLLCDTSDNLPPKMEEGSHLIPKNDFNWGYNTARKEDILWVNKKLMGVEALIDKELLRYKELRYMANEKRIKALATAIIQSFGLKNND